MGRGALLFKGESVKKKKKKSKPTSDTSNKELMVSSLTTTIQHGERSSRIRQSATQQPPSGTLTNTAQQSQPQSPQIQQGTGHITTSGTVVTGHSTRFQKELNVGDAILVKDEMRVITMRLSDMSLNLSSPFTINHKAPVSFQYIAKPKVNNEIHTNTKQEQHAMEEQHSYGIYGGSVSDGQAIVYREKTAHGSYSIKRVQVDGEMDRTDLLEFRTKKKSDKYC